jgi:hypothetical protein
VPGAKRYEDLSPKLTITCVMAATVAILQIVIMLDCRS